MTTYSRFAKSLKKSEIKTVTIGSQIDSEGYNYSNSIAKIFNAIINDKKAYAVEIVSWGFDDVDDSTYLFWNKKDAQSCVAYFARPLSQIVLEHENKTVELTYEDGSIKHIAAEVYKGYIVNSYYEGEWLKPFFNSRLMSPSQSLVLKKNYDTIDEWDIRDVIGTEFESLLVKVGKNEGFVATPCFCDESNEYHKKEVKFSSHYCWETGITYHRLCNKVPKDIFKQLALWFHNEEIEEEGNWKGWCAGPTTKAALDNLKLKGWSSNFPS